MKFSVCIPNYNYESYLGETIDSVLASDHKEFEIVIADNASTDRSVDIVKRAQDVHQNIKLQINPCNVGFAANLDRCGQMADGSHMIMLSSDDLTTAAALSIYDGLISVYPQSIICSSCDIIDSKSEKIGFIGPNRKLWTSEDLDEELSERMNCNVFKVRSETLLRRCLENMANPFNFCSVAYPRSFYEEVGGYGSGRIINPDKWFHWRLLTVAREAIFIDLPLFKYRWHNQNQTSQQASSGHLKYMVDEYRNVMEMSGGMLERAGLLRHQFDTFFVKTDIYRHGIGEFSKGRWLKSLRIFFFGLSTFPRKMLLTKLFIPYLLLLLSSPLGSMITAVFIQLFRKK